MSAVRLARAAIKIPKRIERGPTDLLKALSSTIKPSEIDINIVDDPYLSVSKPTDAINYSLARLSGRNTAKFLLDKHPELFYRDDAEPKILALSPPEKFTENMDFSVDHLNWCIENQDPVNGLVVYKSLIKEKTAIDNQILLRFFELLCYTNEAPMMNVFDQQKSYYANERPTRLWKKDGLMNKIFDDIKHLEPSRVFSSMIAGLIKYKEHELAKQLFNDFKESHSDLGLHQEAYDCMLAAIFDKASSNETAHTEMKEIIDHMTAHNVAPNLLIVNSIMAILTKFNIDQEAGRTAFQLINDLRALNIEPSLHTYASLFSILFRSRELLKNMKSMKELLSYVSQNSQLLTIRDERDLEFFYKTMILFGSRLHNLELSNQLFKIQLKNPNLFPNYQNKFAFYDIYFRLLINTEKLENIMSFYDTYVPAQFRPNGDSYDSLAEALDLFQADEATIKRIGADLIKFHMADKIKNDAIFKRDPKYVEEAEKQMELR